MNKPIFFLLSFFFTGCTLNADRTYQVQGFFKTIADIPPPSGYERMVFKAGSFAEWLRSVHLRKDNHVYLYNGSLKPDQSVQFSVLDIPIGKKDLLQCADAVIKLKAEYLFSGNQFNRIEFKATDGTNLSFADWRKGIRYKLSGSRLHAYHSGIVSKELRKDFDDFLEIVYSYCGTLSLQAELKKIDDINAIQPGDVFVNGGSPGHAMTVMDVAVNDQGKKVFMLSQGYMPAQDIHVVKNPTDEKLSPWYLVSNTDEIITPEYKFFKNQLMRW